jgi:hypothetical protein
MLKKTTMSLNIRIDFLKLLCYTFSIKLNFFIYTCISYLYLRLKHTSIYVYNKYYYYNRDVF